VSADTPDPLALRADAALQVLRGLCEPADVAQARTLLKPLRDVRDHTRLLHLAEAVLRHDPRDASTRCLQAQAVIESGLATVAVTLLQALLADLPDDPARRAEATGLLGRAWKQVFFDAADKSAGPAREALAAAVAAYRGTYEADRNCTWHGVNLLALLRRARLLGVAVATDLSPRALAQELMATLQALPPSLRDEWTLPTLAEVAVGLEDWDAAEHHLNAYVALPDVPSFLVASTLRQFTEVWDLAQCRDPRGRGLVQLLRARLLQLSGAQLQLSAPEMRQLQGSAQTDAPAQGQLEAVLGTQGPQTYAWWLTGLVQARAVAAIKRRLGQRMGTGFLVRASDLGLGADDELLLMTNHHVVNADVNSPAVRPSDAQVVFEAVDGQPVYDVAAIVWSSPPEAHDTSVLRLSPAVTGIQPLRIASDLPGWPPAADAGRPPPRVYIVGHPGGRELAFSFQDNELLGHEGPPQGRPPKPGICRVHYRAPTEGGSSGSPVFNDSGWELIALHHMGGRFGMPRLNGEAGTYASNEGIALRSIIDAIAREKTGSN